MITRPPRLRTPLLFLLGIVVLALVADRVPVLELADRLSGWIQSLGAWGVLAYIVVFAFWGLVLPKGPLLALAGVAFGLRDGLVLAYIGSTVTVALGFWLARTLARRRIQAWMAQRPWAQAWEHALSEQGGRLVLLLRLSPMIPGHLQNYLYGCSRIRLRICLAATWLGILPYTLLCVGAGAAASPETRATLALEGGWVWALAIAGLVATAIAGRSVCSLARRRLAELAPVGAAQAA